MSQTETAILAGGCFWGMQDLIRKLPGVVSTRVGYSGGDVPHATYRNHGTHAEAIEVVFDPKRLSYRELLEFFFQIHDPTTKNRQGNDVGMSYRSGIYYLSDEQREMLHGDLAVLADGDEATPLAADAVRRSLVEVLRDGDRAALAPRLDRMLLGLPVEGRLRAAS